MHILTLILCPTHTHMQVCAHTFSSITAVITVTPYIRNAYLWIKCPFKDHLKIYSADTSISSTDILKVFYKFV